MKPTTNFIMIYNYAINILITSKPQCKENVNVGNVGHQLSTCNTQTRSIQWHYVCVFHAHKIGKQKGHTK